MIRPFRSPRPLFSALVCGLAAIFAWLSEPGKGGEHAPAPAKRKIVFVAGPPSHGPGEHEHRAGCLLLADHLNRSGLPVEAVVVTGGWPEDPAAFEDAAAVVIFSDGGKSHPAVKHLAALKSMAAAGVGIGCIHYAVEVPQGEAGAAFLDLLGGYFEAGWSVNPMWDASFKLNPHEITRGIGDFDIREEFYYHMRFRENLEGVTPILSDLPPPESLSRPDGSHTGNPHVRAAVLDRKEPQHVLWAYERPAEAGKGRGFGFTGGHFHQSWRIDPYRRVVLNAILWIAHTPVPEDGIRSERPTGEEIQANLDDKG